MNGKLDAAQVSFTQAIAADPGFIEPKINRGILSLRRSKFDEANRDLEAAYTSATGDLKAAAAFHRALAEDGLGKSRAAHEWIQKALAVRADYPDAILYSGVILEKLRRFEEAGKAYRRFLELSPDSVVALLRFGVVAHRAGFRDTAIQYLQRVVKLAPDSAEAMEARKFLVMWD